MAQSRPRRQERWSAANEGNMGCMPSAVPCTTYVECWLGSRGDSSSNIPEDPSASSTSKFSSSSSCKSASGLENRTSFMSLSLRQNTNTRLSARGVFCGRVRGGGGGRFSALANNGHQGGRRACHGVPHRCRALGRCVQSRRTPRAPPADTVGLPPAPPARCAPDPPASLFAAPTAPALVCGAPRSVAPTVGSHRPRAPRGCRRKSRRRVCAEGPWAQPRNSDTPAGETAWG
jgi:hypothetical protein